MNALKKTQQKTRRDKGLILATRRDLRALPIVAHHYVARQDHLREILSKFPGGPLKSPESGLLAETTCKDQFERWRRAGWISVIRIANEPAYCYVAKRGLELIGLDELYQGKSPAVLRFHHYWCVMHVRLNWKQKAGALQFIPERRLRAEALYVKHIPDDHAISAIQIERGAIPDAVMYGRGWCDAIEVQLSALKPSDMQDKLKKICFARYSEVESQKTYIYNHIHFYVPTEALKRHVEQASEHLEETHRERINIVVEPAFAGLY